MIYRVSASVESLGQLPSEVTVEAGELTYRLTPDEDGLLSDLSVERRVSDYADLLPTATLTDEDILEFNMRHLQTPLHEELVSALQYVESLGSLFLHISRVHWIDARWEWIAEGDEEKQALAVASASLRYEYPKDPTPVDPQTVGVVLEARPRVDNVLTVPMSFFREGANDYSDHKYVNAFINFYLYVEHLYSNGKTKNDHVERELLKSTHVRDGVQNWMDLQDQRFGDDHVTALNNLLSERQWPYDVEHLVRLLVRVRGEVHHSSSRSSKRQGNPFNHLDYRSVAYLAMGICIHSMGRVFDYREPPC